MPKFGKETVVALYRVRAGKETEFRRLLETHWPTLDRLGLTNGEPALVFRGKDASGGPLFVEIFTWKDARSVEVAHETPEVAAIWEPMGRLVEDRPGAPRWEFPHVEPLVLPHARAT
jgi:hypothetical protein